MSGIEDVKQVFEGLERPEDQAPKVIYGYRPYLLSFCASWASAMYGYDSAFIGGTLTLPSFMKSYGLDKATKTELASLSSNIVSTFQAGAFFGCAFGFLIGERFGRKPTILLSAVVFIIGAVLQLIGLTSLLYLGRVFTGLGVGASAMLLPIYIAECVPAKIRGRLVGVFEIMLQVATVFGFWVNYGVQRNISGQESKQWHIPIAVQFVPAGLLITGMIPMIESPRWLVSKDRSREALKALSWVRNLPEDHEYLQTELRMIENGVLMELEATGDTRNWRQIGKELLKRGVRNRLAIGMGLVIFQNLTGINAINYYSPTIFTAIGFTGSSVGLLATGVYGIVKTVTTFVFMTFIVDRFGRRIPLLIGAIGAGFAMYYLAIYVKLSDSLHHVPSRDAGANTAVAMIYIYAVFYAFSWNGIPWLFTAEVLPTRVRTSGMAAVVCVQWLFQFVVVYALPHMVLGIGYGTFLFFAVCTTLALVFAYFCVPETKGLSIEEMHVIFGPDQRFPPRRLR